MSNFPCEQDRAVIDDYVRFFENLAPDTIDNIQGLISNDFNFVDPFNDVRGREKIALVLQRMFDDLEEPQFQILDVVWSDEHCFIRWDFNARQKWLGTWTVRGLSELHINEDGLISAHLDYWDSGRYFYSRLPVVGPLVRWIARRAAV